MDTYSSSLQVNQTYAANKTYERPTTSHGLSTPITGHTPALAHRERELVSNYPQWQRTSQAAASSTAQQPGWGANTGQPSTELPPAARSFETNANTYTTRKDYLARRAYLPNVRPSYVPPSSYSSLAGALGPLPEPNGTSTTSSQPTVHRPVARVSQTRAPVPKTPSANAGSSSPLAAHDSRTQRQPAPTPSSSRSTNQRRRTQRRSKTANAPPPAELDNIWKCPYCTFTQSNAGVQDCQRHLDTHAIPGAPVWICCGIPASEAPDPPGTRENFFARPVLEFLPGFWLVGGCNKLFSRRDALERHLRTRKGKCLGDERASYQPGNNLTRTPFRSRP